jgi:hypothetical protein
MTQDGIPTEYLDQVNNDTELRNTNNEAKIIAEIFNDTTLIPERPTIKLDGVADESITNP